MTAMPPTWAILVPTLGERAHLFERLLSSLLPQTSPFGERVRVVGWLNDGKPSLPEIRQQLVTEASTDYVSFVDDDDLVSPYYVDEIMSALGQRPDYVGFQVQCYSNGRPTAVAYHSLAHKRWVNERNRYLRDISHINPVRRDLALKADFRQARSGGPEDRIWASQLRRLNVLRTEVVVNRIMYHYLHCSPDGATGSRWKKPALIRAGAARPPISHPNFTWSTHDLP